MTDDTLRDRLEVALCHALCTSDTADHDPTVHRAVNAALAVYRDGHAAWVSRAWHAAENRAEQAEADRDRHIGAHRRDNQYHTKRSASLIELARHLENEHDRQRRLTEQAEAERDVWEEHAQDIAAERDRHQAAFERASAVRDSAVQERDTLQQRLDDLRTEQAKQHEHADRIRNERDRVRAERDAARYQAESTTSIASLTEQRDELRARIDRVSALVLAHDDSDHVQGDYRQTVQWLAGYRTCSDRVMAALQIRDYAPDIATEDSTDE